MSVFTCRRVACEDTGRAAYSQLRLRVTGEYNHQQVGISSQTTEYGAHHPVYTQQVHSYLRTRSQVRNFEHVVSKTQRVHAAAFSHFHKRC